MIESTRDNGGDREGRNDGPERAPTHIMGSGVLTWSGSERRSDRYGSVFLMESPHDSDGIVLKQGLEGKYGKLYAVVVETRESHHIGDMFRGIYPSTPNVDDKIELGEGTFFYKGELNAVGLYPADERGADWLDPNALYRVHDQTVTLYFEEMERPES